MSFFRYSFSYNSFTYFSHCGTAVTASAEEEDIGEEVSSFPFPSPSPFTSKDTMSLFSVLTLLISNHFSFFLLRLYASILVRLSLNGFITSFY